MCFEFSLEPSAVSFLWLKSGIYLWLALELFLLSEIKAIFLIVVASTEEGELFSLWLLNVIYVRL